MSMLQSTREHVAFDEEGRALVADTTIKVIEIVLDHIAEGWSPAEIHLQHDRAVSMAQIHAALAHYYDLQAEFDAEIERQRSEAERLGAEAAHGPLRQRLRAEGKLR